MATVKQKETADEVLKEVRAIKEKLARSMGFDVGCILADAREKQARSGRRLISPPPRRNT